MNKNEKKKVLDNLLGIEQALFIIAFAIIWKPLGLFVFTMFLIKAYQEEQERKK